MTNIYINLYDKERKGGIFACIYIDDRLNGYHQVHSIAHIWVF